MSVRLDVSRGIEPVPVFSDIRNDCYVCRTDGQSFVFDRLPFTLKNVRLPGSQREVPCADRYLILKHSDKAKVKDLSRQEVVHG